MTIDCKYGFGTELSVGFEEALHRVETQLNQHGFRIFTRLNLKDIVEGEQIGELSQYVILGACNTEFAKVLFSTDTDIGLLMPCNIIVYELRNGVCRIMVKDPLHIMDLMKNPIEIQTAMQIKQQLETVIDELN